MQHLYYKRVIAITIAIPLFIATANAQLRGTHILGLVGLKAGTPAPPSISAFIPSYDYYTTDFRNKDGNSVAGIPRINMFITSLGFSYNSNYKILSGNYSATLLLPFASSEIDGGSIYSKSSVSFSDIYIQPIQLGWETPNADFIANYALYLPTGRYIPGGDDNSGLGMLSNEFAAGSTVYLSSKKDWHFSALFSYELNGKRKNAGGNDIVTGNLLSIEGGLGKTFYQKMRGSSALMEMNAGMVYYMQFKTTDDKVPASTTLYNDFLGTHDHIYGLGLEANVLLPKSFTTILFRWVSEFDAVNRFRGNTYLITVGQLLKPLIKKK